MNLRIILLVVAEMLNLSAYSFENSLQQDVTGTMEIILTPYTTTIYTGGSNHAPLSVRVVDGSGDQATGYNSRLELVVKGDANLKPIEGGSPLIKIPGNSGEVKWESEIIEGEASFNLFAGSIPGKIIVEVRTGTLKPASSEIHSIAPFKTLKPRKEQIKQTEKIIEQMIGADISFLPQLESRGIKFSDGGIQKDAIEILKAHGFNYIRLRMFNDPADPKGYSPGMGFCDLEQTKAMAKRTKKAGMKLLLGFHYSDYWADPQQQNKPHNWSGLQFDKLCDSVRIYTRNVLMELKDQGTLPDMIQVGNEINHGFLWPDGHIGNPDNLASLIRSAISGIKEVDASIIIMLHVALGGQNEEALFWFDNMFSRDVDCDVIGLSYYPRWHGTLTDLKENMEDLISRYKKDIILVEYSQKKEEVNDIVFNLPGGRGKGTCIWEPLNTWEKIFERSGESNRLLYTYDKIAAKYLSSERRTINIPTNDLWPRPVIIPLPEMTAGVNDPLIRLDGTWKVSFNPPPDFWLNTTDPAGWNDIKVPASADMQNFRIIPDKQFAYKVKFKIPADYSNKRIILRFEGVTGTAKAWINGNYLREHFGGFNIWNCDITEFVTPGEEAWLTVSVLEETKKTSSSFNTGGIIRSVKLFAVNGDYISRLNVETDLDNDYRDATMKVWIAARFNSREKIKVLLKLKDNNGNPVAIDMDTLTFARFNNEMIIPLKVINPAKWSAEYPYLYTLEASVIENGRVVQTVQKKTGFREIEIREKKMFVNGMEVKLRGGGRFDSDPVNGRFLSPEMSQKEVRMLKNANLNFVRPSCYPTTEDYFDACDSIGLYVQAENAVTFAKGTPDDTLYTNIYMSQMAEMVEADRSHPSIIIWELANETYYGINIGKTFEYARAEDPSRPVIYSWSHSVPPEIQLPYEIYSYHYPDWDQDLGKSGVAVFNSLAVRELPQNMPVLHDEFAHGSSYYPVSLSRDPGMRNFWGESIKRFWERMFTTNGCLGGAIWAVIDENAPGGWTYEWGMIDLWRRERPEYWLMKKAYSPVRIDDKPLGAIEKGKNIEIAVKNWYDHTNLRDLKFHWSAGTSESVMSGPDVKPHEEGILVIPGGKFKKSDTLAIKIYDRYNMLVDEYSLPFVIPANDFTEPSGTAPRLREDDRNIFITGKDFEIIFSKTTGMISKGTFRNDNILTGGPCFNLIGGDLISSWKLKSITARKEKKEIVVVISGSNNPVEITFTVRITGNGLITTDYVIDKFGISPPLATKVPWNRQDGGGFEEAGVFYYVTSSANRLSWQRDGLWSVYPDDHIGRNSGTAVRHIDGPLLKFGDRPVRPWSLDEQDFSVHGTFDIGGRGTNDFRSMKEYIHFAEVFKADSKWKIKAESDGSDAIRLEVVADKTRWIDNNSPSVRYAGSWTEAPDTIDCFGAREVRSMISGDFVEFDFNGTGVCLIGTKGNNAGSIDVFIDGKPETVGVNLRSRGLNGSQMIIYSKSGLTHGKHTIKIIVRNEVSLRSPQRTFTGSAAGQFVPVDGFLVLDENDTGGEVKMIINNKWNHTKMGLGNYMKAPILIETGYKGRVRFRLMEKE